MTQVRYTVEEIHDPAWFPPPLGDPYASSHGLVRVWASWGQQKVPSPRPAALPPYGNSRQTQGSYVAPDWFLPGHGVAFTTNMQPPVRWTPNDSAIPAATQSFATVPLPAMKGRKIGGRRAMRWPRVAPQWLPLYPRSEGPDQTQRAQERRQGQRRFWQARP